MARLATTGEPFSRALSRLAVGLALAQAGGALSARNRCASSVVGRLIAAGKTTTLSDRPRGRRTVL
jgi:hypothetical protein